MPVIWALASLGLMGVLSWRIPMASASASSKSGLVVRLLITRFSAVLALLSVVFLVLVLACAICVSSCALAITSGICWL